ncbi:24369_t:CDS:2, partial [Entrophospora sp. SA101]
EFHMFFYTQNGIPKIIEGLEYQSKHLRKIVLKRNRIHDGGYITRILNLEGLEDLIIKHCWLETGERHWPVEKKLHSLVKFKFVLNDPILIIKPINYLTTTDFNDSSKLREFTYDENRFQMDFVTIAMHISTYFTNLVYLDLCIYITVPSLSEILLSCNKLEKIIVKDRGWKQNWQSEKNENILNIDKLMKEINLIKLRHLELKGVFSFSAHSLEQYLKKSNPPLEVMEILGSYDFGNEHLEVLLESLNVRLQKLSIESRIGLKRTLKAKATKIIKNFKYEFIKQKKSNQQLFDINTPYPNTRSRKKLEETDLWMYQIQLTEIDNMRKDGKFYDKDGNVPEGQTLLSSSEPIAEPLMPIHNQLQTVRKFLKEIKKFGTPFTELYPYQMKLASIDNLRVDGKFIDDDGSIPEGQGIIAALLNECYDILYELKADVEEDGYE